MISNGLLHLSILLAWEGGKKSSSWESEYFLVDVSFNLWLGSSIDCFSGMVNNLDEFVHFMGSKLYDFFYYVSRLFQSISLLLGVPSPVKAYSVP